MTAAELAQFPDLFPPPAPPGQWYLGSCGTPPTNFPVTKFRVFAGAPNAALLAVQAVNALRLTMPVIRWNPPSSTNVLVHVPVWFWLDSGSWASRSATASVPGLSVTATATPASLLISTGDGGTESCKGPGTAWSSGTDPKAASPTCGHTYDVASTGVPGGTFTVTATVTWHVSWAGGGQSGTVADMQTTTRVSLAVGESQTVTLG